MFIANPNNPTGTIFKRDEFEWFLDKVPEDVLVLIDEAYFEYVEDGEYPDTLKYHDSGKSILTVRTFSKIFGLAGLRIGYGVGSEAIVSNMHKVRHPFNVNSLAQSGAIAALDDHTVNDEPYPRLLTGGCQVGFTRATPDHVV